MHIQEFVGKPGVKYLGQHKPRGPYALSDNLYIVPAGSGMFPYAGGQIHLNVSYFLSTEPLDDAVLEEIFREWLVFDSLAMDDRFPISYYDNNALGVLETIPLITSEPHNGTDYSNIAYLTLRARKDYPGLPVLSYAELFRKYQTLEHEKKEMIEWLASKPHRTHTRPRAFFNTNYWQLLHLTILLERIVGQPPSCERPLGTCSSCGYSPPPHYSMRRRDWLERFLQDRIPDQAIAEEYFKLISTALSVRNKIAHVPVFDRSAMPDLEPGETQSYGTDRAIDEYDHNSVALASLLVALDDICHYLLLDVAFETRFFMGIQPLNVTRLGGQSKNQ